MIQQFSRLALSSQDYLFSQIGDSQIPSQFHDSADIDKLDCIHIQNFKSFDKKFIGPFLNFTCIIGPNGSGKSNILDALMFCFCSQNSRHSLLDARELINRQGKQSFKQLSKLNKVCSVQATFILKDRQKFVICRNLDAQGKEQFLIDYKTVNKRVYQNVLIRKGINCNSPNYAIWQGQIDRLVLKDPMQLTSLLQNLSGSIYFKKAYEDVKEKLKEIQSHIQQKTRRINKFKMDKKNLKAIKQTNQQYAKYDAQYQQILKKIYYIQVLEKDRSIDDLMQQLKIASEEQKKRMIQINQLKASAQRDHAKKLQLQDQMNDLMASLAESYTQLKNVGNPANILKIQRLKQAEQQVKNKSNEFISMQERKRFLMQNSPELPSSQLIEEYLSLYEEWQSQNSSLHRQISKKKNQLLYIQGLIQSKADLMTQFQSKKSKHSEKKQQKRKVIQTLKNDLQNLKQSIKKMQSESSQVSQQIQKNKQQYNKKNQHFEQLCTNINDLQTLIAQQAQDQKQAEMLKILANIDGFYGALHQKIKPTSAKFDICFSIVFGAINKYLLCQSQQCAKRIGNRLRQIRLMKNVIILDNVVDKRNNDIRKALGKDGSMAIDIVDFDQDTKGLKQYLGQFLHGKVVCDTISNAYKIRNKNIQGVKQIYTLDGNVVRRDGTISTHGNPQSIKKTHKYTNNKSTIYQDISKLNKQKIKVETELKNLRIKFDDKQILKRNLQIDQMNRKKEIMIAKLKQLENTEQKQPSLPQSVINQSKQLQKQKIKLSKVLIELQKQVGSSKIFDKFLQKHKISSLQAFRNANNFEYIQQLMKKKHQSNKQIANIEAALQRMDRQIQRKKKQVSILHQQVENIPQMGDKNKIQKIIAQKQKQLIEIRNKLSKLSNVSRAQVFFQSILPPLQAKLNYSKQKIEKDLQDLAYQLGLEFKYPIPHDQILQELKLPRKYNDKHLENMTQKLEQQRSKIQDQLDKHNSINLLTNMQQDEQKIHKGMNDAIQQIDQYIKDRKKYTDQLQSIRKDRATLLINFVNILKGYLNQSYSLLTEQEDGHIGTVNLHLESQDQPFQHGIYFTPTPPTKRFVYDLEQLSGGEKSIASLALQYSLSIASKSPILILDETDAFLDFGNVTRFLKLINKSLLSHKIQMVIVTHKQGLFSKSQSLVGVSRPKSLNLSQVYSLKLIED